MLDSGQLLDHIRTLDKGDETTLRKTMHALRVHTEEEWAKVPAKPATALVTALQDVLNKGLKHPSLRQDAVSILGNLGARAAPAIPLLIDLLQEGVPDGVRDAAVTALGKMEKGAQGAVQRRLRTALADLWLSSSQSHKSQLQVAIALCKLQCEVKGMVRFLTATLSTSQESSLRKAAVEGLGWCSANEKEVVPALLAAAVHDKDEAVRLLAEKGLEQLHLTREQAIQRTAKQLGESAYAETALRNCGPAAVPALIAALNNAKEPVGRDKAARILGVFGEAAVAAVPALTNALKDKAPEVRLTAGKSLWNITKNADPVVPVFVKLLEHKWTPEEDVGEARRMFLQTVLESLGRIGPPAAASVPALNKVVKDKNRHISEAALHALKQIAPNATPKVKAR